MIRDSACSQNDQPRIMEEDRVDESVVVIYGYVILTNLFY